MRKDRVIYFHPVFWADPVGADSESNSDSSSSSSNSGTGVTLAFGVSLDSVMGTSAVGFTSYADSYETTDTKTYKLSTSISVDENNSNGATPSDCMNSDVIGESTRLVSVSKTTHHQGGADAPNGSSFMSTALGGYQRLMSTQTGRNYYNNLHNSALSKSIDNAVMGTIVSVAMLPLAAEYGTIILLKYGADVTMQYIMTGNVNFYNAAVGSVLPSSIAPVGSELTNVTQSLLKGDDINVTSSALKVATGYVGNGLGKAASETSMGINGSEVLQSFHNNLQSTMIEQNISNQ